MSAVITLENLKKSFPGFTLDIPRLEVRRGYITGFIGENGAGKTTTLRLIMDLLHPDEGSISVLGGDMRREAETLKQDIGYVDSLAYFNAAFKVGKAKSVVAPFYKNWDEDLYRHYCRRFNIQENKKIRDLSTGQNKLFSLIMALCHRPKLLILDEPTSSLDPVIRAELLDMMAELLQDGGISIFYSTHITSDLDKTADYIAYIQGGRLLFHEEKDRMLEEFRIVRGDPGLLQRDDPLLTGVRTTAVGFTALTRDAEGIRRKYGENLHMEKPNLEDIMVYTAKENGHSKQA